MDRKSLNKALFLADIAIINDDFVYDLYFVSALTEFVYEYYLDYKKYLDLIFDFNIGEDGGYTVQLFSGQEEYVEILNLVSKLDNDKTLKKLLDDVGDKNVMIISKMAVLFCSFLNEYNEMFDSTFVRIKQ